MHAGRVVLSHTLTLLQGQLSPTHLECTRVLLPSVFLSTSLSVVNKSVSFRSWHVNRLNGFGSSLVGSVTHVLNYVSTVLQ